MRSQCDVLAMHGFYLPLPFVWDNDGFCCGRREWSGSGHQLRASCIVNFGGLLFVRHVVAARPTLSNGMYVALCRRLLWVLSLVGGMLTRPVVHLMSRSLPCVALGTYCVILVFFFFMYIPRAAENLAKSCGRATDWPSPAREAARHRQRRTGPALPLRRCIVAGGLLDPTPGTHAVCAAQHPPPRLPLRVHTLATMRPWHSFCCQHSPARGRRVVPPAAVGWSGCRHVPDVSSAQQGIDLWPRRFVLSNLFGSGSVSSCRSMV